MELIRGLHNLKPRHHGCVATIGNFDGVHLGHQAVLSKLMRQAEKMGLPSTVILFEPQPREYFSPQGAPARLASLREKYLAMAELGVERLLCLPFNRKLSDLLATDFVRQVLIDGLGVKFLVVGDDFRFGHNREGNFNLLRQTGRDHGFQVIDTQTYAMNDCRVSSTRIRTMLKQSDLSAVEDLLGRKYRISSRVAYGDQLGRQLGFPTANLIPGKRKLGVQGVYVVRFFAKGQSWYGMANAGFRPTVDGREQRLETHLFDYDGDLYGCYASVEFIHRLRPEQRFSGPEELKQQLAIDKLQALDFLAEYTANSH
ncbi:bifunctional riboflavin kinase/FAD synthetase [Pelagibaculum spongiae]|uniref:Riboflavin biosynthesis protein n=1 Tax=Pelagibaculum spongiae TaxID=2080658 RepID=A0A2V1H476_9GAMM|nr:bifunctional riboflavin kinase/FAD synthetase [Pelagibaculum spongiae]PVZ70436.1 bifunctional riboflavin kinase/FAD synthetase [Pelagibaculum spongiae]